MPFANLVAVVVVVRQMDWVEGSAFPWCRYDSERDVVRPDAAMTKMSFVAKELVAFAAADDAVVAAIVVAVAAAVDVAAVTTAALVRAARVVVAVRKSVMEIV